MGVPTVSPGSTSAQRPVVRWGVGAALLTVALSPEAARAQWGDLRVEVGASRALAPSGTDVDAATYLTAALQVDRWSPSGSGVFAGLLGGVATDSTGGDWASFMLGGDAVAGAGGPVELHLSGTAYGFAVGGPFAYEALTVTARPEARVPVGPLAFVLYGEAGRGTSTLTFSRGDQVRTFTRDLWHYGAGPEVQLRLGPTLTSLSLGVLETELGTYRRGELTLRATGVNGSLVDLAARAWDTPAGGEATGSIAVVIPVGGADWFVRLVGGRTDPDPLVQSEPGSQATLVVGRRLIGFGPSRDETVVDLAEAGGRALAVFRIERGDARDVELVGDFTGWQPRAMTRRGGAWTLEIPLPRGAYHFGFLVDGEWFVPVDAPGQVSDDWGQMNATIVVP